MSIVSIAQLPPTLDLPSDYGVHTEARDRVGGELWYYLRTDELGPAAYNTWSLAPSVSVAAGDSVTVDGVEFTAALVPTQATEFASGTLEQALPSLAIAINNNASLANVTAIANDTAVLVQAVNIGTPGAFVCTSGVNITATETTAAADGNEGAALAATGQFGVWLQLDREFSGVTRPVRIELAYQPSNSYRFEVAPYLRDLPIVPEPVSGVVAASEAVTYSATYGYYLREEQAEEPYYVGSGKVAPRAVIKGATPYQATPPDANQWAELPVQPTTLFPFDLAPKLIRRLSSCPEYVYWWVIPELVPDAQDWRVQVTVLDTYGYPMDTRTYGAAPMFDRGWVYADVSPNSLGYSAAVTAEAAAIEVALQYDGDNGWMNYSDPQVYTLDTQYTPDRYTSLRWQGRAGVWETFTFDGTFVETAENSATNYTRQVSDVYGWQRQRTPSPSLATEGAISAQLNSGWVNATHYHYLRDLVGAVRIDVLVDTPTVAAALGVQGYTSPQWVAVQVIASGWERESTAGLFNLSLTVRPAADTVYTRE